MTNLPVLLLAVGVCPLSAGAQVLETSTVKTIACIDKQPNCDVRFINGIETKGLFAKDVSIIASLLKDDGRLVVFLNVSNSKEANKRIELSPENVHLLRLHSGSQPVEIKQKKGADIAKSNERRQRISSALSAFGAGMSQQTATVQSSDGTSSTVRVHDPATDAHAREQAAINNTAAHNYGSRLVEAELKRNTLLPGQDVMGRVYFDQKATTAAYVIRVVLDDANYEIPFLVIKK